ncbi:MAG: M28 family peptidase, partial [Bacteroidia bacterium]|nr:M28 family peptidase [Bacteroidia bacterium]
FIAFSGEEKGLLGSEHFVKFPCVPIEKMVAVLNVDMIGRTDSTHANNPMYVYVIGSDFLSKELHEINKQAAEITGDVQLDYLYNNKKHPSRLFYRSDHYHFAEKHIPCIFYFSGFHKDYHKPSDDIDKINFHKVQKVSQLISRTAWILANRANRIEVDR